MRDRVALTTRCFLPARPEKTDDQQSPIVQRAISSLARLNARAIYKKSRDEMRERRRGGEDPRNRLSLPVDSTGSLDRVVAISVLEHGLRNSPFFLATHITLPARGKGHGIFETKRGMRISSSRREKRLKTGTSGGSRGNLVLNLHPICYQLFLLYNLYFTVRFYGRICRLTILILCCTPTLYLFQGRSGKIQYLLFIFAM